MYERTDTFVRADPDRRCPRCGAVLLTDGDLLWCSKIGTVSDSGTLPACRFGLDARVAVADVPAPDGGKDADSYKLNPTTTRA